MVGFGRNFAVLPHLRIAVTHYLENKTFKGREGAEKEAPNPLQIRLDPYGQKSREKELEMEREGEVPC